MNTVITGLVCLILAVSLPLKSSTNNLTFKVNHCKNNSTSLSKAFPEKGYAELTREPNGDFIYIYNLEKLKIQYTQEYSFTSSDFYYYLIYRVYNEDREIVLGYDIDEGVILPNSPLVDLELGENFESIDCSSLSEGNYLLEVDLPKGGNLYLRFKKIETPG